METFPTLFGNIGIVVSDLPGGMNHKPYAAHGDSPYCNRPYHNNESGFSPNHTKYTTVDFSVATNKTLSYFMCDRKKSQTRCTHIDSHKFSSSYNSVIIC